jgi:F420-0:gamma-glutamyl ligase
MIPDPTEEIKIIRHRLGAELGYDLHKIIADTRARQDQSGRTYIRLKSREPRITKHCIEVADQPFPDGGSTPATR